MKRRGLYALAFGLGLLGLWYVTAAYRASAAGSLPDLVEGVPAGSNVIAYADLAALRESPWVQQLTSLAQPVQLDKDYIAFMNGTGFDYQRDLDRVVVAGGSAPSDPTLVLAEGRFDRQKIEQYALRSGKLQQENGRAVFVVPSDTPGKNVRFTFVSADRIALSSGGDLSALDSASAAPALDAAMRERLSRVAGAPVFAVLNASTFTRGLASGARANGGLNGGVATQFQSLRWIALAAQPNTSDVLVSIEGECDRPEDAQRVAGTLELMRGIFRGAMADPKAQGRTPASAETIAASIKLLDSVQITTETVRVRLLVSMTPEMLRLAPLPAPANK